MIKVYDTDEEATCGLRIGNSHNHDYTCSLLIDRPNTALLCAKLGAEEPTFAEFLELSWEDVSVEVIDGEWMASLPALLEWIGY